MRSNLFWALVASAVVLRPPDGASAWRRPSRRCSAIAVKRKFSSPLWNSHLYLSTFPRGGMSLDKEDEGEEVVPLEDKTDIGNSDDKGEIVVEPLQPESANEEDRKNHSEEEEVNETKATEIEEEVEEDDDDEEEEDDDDTDVNGKDVNIEGLQIELKVEKYDEPSFASPMSSLYASIGVMLLSRKVDLFHPTVVRLARFVFIMYIVLHQCFLFYVRIQARQNNDRTPIELTNPFSALLQNQLGGGSSDGFGGNSMIKNLASSLLTSQSTVLEYDLKQARSLQSGLIFNMLFMWFLHFKMGQVQPLLIQSVNGFISLVYNPLFQVYVLGRNLERPFKTNAFIKQVAEGSASDTLSDLYSGKSVVENDEDESGIEAEGPVEADTEDEVDDTANVSTDVTDDD